MKMASAISNKYIAACGINCYCCYMRLRSSNGCTGCFDLSEKKPKSCISCTKKVCAEEKGIKYCIQCDNYPCSRIKSFNKRYLTRYAIDLNDNLSEIQKNGIKAFMQKKKLKWECKQCKGIINMHTKVCSECGKDYAKQ